MLCLNEGAAPPGHALRPVTDAATVRMRAGGADAPIDHQDVLAATGVSAAQVGALLPEPDLQSELFAKVVLAVCPRFLAALVPGGKYVGTRPR